MLNPMGNMQSFMDRYLEDERRQMDRYRSLFSSLTKSVIDGILQRSREMEQIADLLRPSKAALDAIKATNGMVAEATRFAYPLRDVLDQIVNWHKLAALRIPQMESAAIYVRKLLDSLPQDDEPDDDIDWEALDQNLEGLQAVIQHLPLRNATDKQLRKRGIAHFE